MNGARKRWVVAPIAALLSLGVCASQAEATGSTAAGTPERTHDGDAGSVIIDWNMALVQAIETAKTPPPPAMRAAAIVQSAVFDAVNGVTHSYRAFHVQQRAPRGADPAAAAIGAAHEALSALFPAQDTAFDALLSSTVAGLQGSSASAVAGGLGWGASVADDILAWRSTDGFTAVPPPYLPSPDPGRYQLTPPSFVSPTFRQFATMTPWTMTSPSQFTAPPPPPLTSRRYTHDFEEVRTYGSANSTARSAFDTETAQFWASEPPVALWDRVADGLLASRPSLGLAEVARVLAQANIAMADAVISIWYGKNTFDTWRPITAIHAADTDGNPQTTADPTWQPLLVTPTFQDYPAGHPGVSEAAAAVLASHFGNRTAFTVVSGLFPSATRSFLTFSDAVAQVVDARIFGGIHFRFSGTGAVTLGRRIALWVLASQMHRQGPREGVHVVTSAQVRGG